MTVTRRHLIQGAGTLALLPALGEAAFAQDYPSQDIRMIVGFPAGSGADIFVRYFAEKLRPIAGRTTIVENKPGANSNVATEFVARSKPDGHVLYPFAGTTVAASMHLFKNPPVDVSKAVELVATLSRQPVMLVVGPNSPAKTLPELTALIKAKGDKAAYGTAFPSARVAGAMYKKLANINATEVQYRTSKDWVNDLTSGAVDFAFIDATSGVGLATEGRLRVIALTMGERSKSLPDYPTMKEGGVALDMPGWWAAFAPTGVPKPVIDQLNKAFSEVVSSEEGSNFFSKLGNDPWVTTPAEGQAVYLKEYKDWGEYVKIANIEPQG